MPIDPARIRVFLLDIEGTTTPIEFVRVTLFPYAGARLEDFLREHYANPDVARDLESLLQQRAKELSPAEAPALKDSSPESRVKAAASYGRWLIDQDRKFTPLKSLQGKIWETGYRRGELRAPVFSDVEPAFRRWRLQGRTISIFSSGSVLAQKLLFQHSTAGDLTSYISAYFDTTTGLKEQEPSYRHIAAALNVQPDEVLFISDAVAELDAARRAGMQTAQCVRPGVPEPRETQHTVVRSLNEVPA